MFASGFETVMSKSAFLLISQRPATNVQDNSYQLEAGPTMLQDCDKIHHNLNTSDTLKCIWL
ncbi:hypothetical protein R5R35_010014 [Gryllus longicercus]|uniref:Uncharacterized protein n=1 Tax=Gryllus longicercus TaxID=2509291 RepID=A0AAN9VTS7_9ORTH